MTPDHFPWNDATLIVPGALLEAPPATRFVKRGFYMCCVDCGKAVEWCACAHRPPADAGSKDGSAESSLEARVRAVKAGK
jgi:hypothetical protein